MDIQNIVNASGLSDGDKSTLGDLVDVYGAVSARNSQALLALMGGGTQGAE